MQEWTQLLDRYGLPLAVLVAFAVFFWRGVWPFLKSQIEQTNAALQQQIKSSHTTREQEMTEFMTALKRRDEEFGKMVNSIDGLREAVEGLRDNVKADGRRR